MKFGMCKVSSKSSLLRVSNDIQCVCKHVNNTIFLEKLPYSN